ncbi:MAG: pyruvate:ferredoxin (flavodoxin) oxidoreductase, partial [Oscillospiraceae bacterium]|nr:pyruvate:ferredoxin (flavodoxin) oxidoreductase [Oscillospiraceae bacterium]
QCIKAFLEAEHHKGPSVIIAYAPCISHGVKGGLRGVQTVEKKAVASGYWKLFRYDPNRIEQGLNPFQLDSKEPSESYRDFLMSEVRYNSLTRSFPERAEALFTQAEKDAMIEYHQLKAKADAPLVQ